jgi:xylulokinase
VAQGYLLGMDIGTSSAKLTLFTPDGEVMFQGTEAYPTLYPHVDYAEQNPHHWWQAICAILKNMFEATRVLPHDIRAIGVAGQSGAVVPLDSHGNTLGQAMIWLDRRSVDACTQLNRTIGEEAIFRVSGNPMAPSYCTGKLVWLQEHEPERYERTAMFLQSNSYIVYKLTDVASQDVSQGNGYHFFHIGYKQWEPSLAHAMGIDLERFPPIMECAQVVGVVTAAAAAATGLAIGTPVVAGGLDAACATLGAGAVRAGEVQDQGGQAGGMSIVMDKLVMNEKLILSAHTVRGKWILQGGTVGGGSLNWFKREFATPGDDGFFVQADQQAASIPPGSEGLLFLPYMAGERSPIWDPDARGTFVGLSYDKTQAHLLRAIMEGCAMALKHNLDTAESSGVPIHALYSVGGAAKSKLWTQIKADVTGKPFHMPASDSATTLGAALLAGVGIGLYADEAEAVKRTVRFQREQQPNPAHAPAYERAYRVYLDVYQRLKDVYPAMKW